MLYVQLLVFSAVVVMVVATVLHESILNDGQGTGRDRSSVSSLASFTLCCVISAVTIGAAGWLLNL